MYYYCFNINKRNIRGNARDLLDTLNIPAHAINQMHWCATWDDDSNSPVFGRILHNNPKYAIIQHWVRIVDFTPSAIHTPSSQRISLSPCKGCRFHAPNKHRSVNIKKNKNFKKLKCVITAEHDEVINLKHLQTGWLFKKDDTNVLPIPYFHLRHQIYASLRPQASHSLDLTDTPVLLSLAHYNLGLHFCSPKGNYIPVKYDTRLFVKHIFDAFNLNVLLDLKRWKHISFLNDSQSIDWTATWSLFKSYLDFPNAHTSFKKSTLKTFRVKLLINELPILHNLQSYRRPDIYNPNWNCLLCDEEKETLTHLWNCSSLSNATSPLPNCTKTAFEQLIILKNSQSFIAFSQQWHNLSIWQLPNPNLFQFSFDLFAQGFVPKSLTNALSPYLTKKDSLATIGLIGSKVTDLLYKEVWLLRCQLFSEKEKALNISDADKTHVSSQYHPISHSSTRHVSNLSQRWNTWITKMLANGSSWTGFLTYINSLIL